jgi:hypothetical protein
MKNDKDQGDAPLTPISGRTKELRELEISRSGVKKARVTEVAQVAKIGALVSAERPRTAQREFNKNFKIACKLDGQEAKLRNAKSKQTRALCEKALERHNDAITPRAKRTVIERQRAFNDAIREDIKQNGEPTNIAEQIKRLRGSGALETTFEHGAGARLDPTRALHDTTARNIIRKQHGIKGTRGRKP